MKKILRISTQGLAPDYRHSLVPLVIKTFGYQINWVNNSSADLLIVGPFFKKPSKEAGTEGFGSVKSANETGVTNKLPSEPDAKSKKILCMRCIILRN